MTTGLETGKNAFGVLCSILIIIGFFLWVDSCLRPDGIAGQKNVVSPKPELNYGTAICDNAWNKTIDHSEDTADHFTVSLPEGCFSSFIILPRSWNTFSYQHGPNNTNGWAAFWFYGVQFPGKPLPIDDNGQLELDKGWAREKWKFRVQGKGSLILYKTN